uniref:GATA transcription factor 12-like n=1 Tax=Erigeron canadensis TaxID=72917 RepID=UPI001CB90E0F|nr:GATA transcription factor 12-like [Erigeron canadensis]
MENADNTTTHDKSKTDHFVIEDLLDFPNDVEMVPHVDEEAPFVNEVVDTCYPDHKISGNVARRSTDTQFSNDLCVQYDDLAELEWLSNVVEESFSCEDLQKLQLLSGIKTRPTSAPNNQDFQPGALDHAHKQISKTDKSVPGKARTKRSRASPGDWTSRLHVVSPTSSTGPTTIISSESETDIASSSTGKKSVKTTLKKKDVEQNLSQKGDGRKCLHCATDRTPQWRSGPLGPKTLCNACGVRYKSGRLVPEYRPAASPTFVLAKHSNSHRKVLELRRQKEMQRAQQYQPQHEHYFHHQNVMFSAPNNDDNYLTPQHFGHDYRQRI